MDGIVLDGIALDGRTHKFGIFGEFSVYQYLYNNVLYNNITGNIYSDLSLLVATL